VREHRRRANELAADLLTRRKSSRARQIDVLPNKERDVLTRYTVLQSATPQGAPQGQQRASDAGHATLRAIRGLTPRQREILAVMMQGKCNKGICRTLNLAEPTVKNHVTAILKALKATNRTEAVVKVASAWAMPMSYTYTISGYSTFLRGSFVPMRAVSAEGHGVPSGNSSQTAWPSLSWPLLAQWT